ncbi:MAG TPA: glycosyltransferase family 39 protein [Gemmatimonadaceae bacterium]|nr:glycosyltransferase family 39 protein [Gemmatimonadaceae bacterium]
MPRTRETALLVAILSSLCIWFVWAAIDPLPLVEDEYSYVLQSRIFASGHWTAPSPPVPEFFQQAHVLTVPAVASKYPPGHALLMSIGSFFGAPALVPLLLTGLTGALLFLLVRRVTRNDWIGLLAWIVWLSDPIDLRFRAAYYSEVTSEAMLFIAWWALLEWRESRKRGWLLALAAAVGWGAVTRPLTMLAFAIPIGVVVIRDVIATKRWADFAAAVALGTIMLGIIPLWSAETTGNWRLTPQTLWTRQYLPFDHPGFGVDTTPPTRPLLTLDRETYLAFYQYHVDHTPAHLPRIALERLSAIARGEWSGPRLALVPFVVIGLTAMNAAAGFALVSGLALFVAYLSYGHWADWTLYYFEALPVLSLLAALGLWRVYAWGRARWTNPAVLRGVRGLAAAGLVLLAGYELGTWRSTRIAMASYDVAFRDLVNRLPMRAAVVFVHYAPRVGRHATVVTNSPHLAEDPVWVVNDLGARDTALMRYAGPRVPLLFYEDGGKIEVDTALIRRPTR